MKSGSFLADYLKSGGAVKESTLGEGVVKCTEKRVHRKVRAVVPGIAHMEIDSQREVCE